MASVTIVFPHFSEHETVDYRRVDSQATDLIENISGYSWKSLEKEYLLRLHDQPIAKDTYIVLHGFCSKVEKSERKRREEVRPDWEPTRTLWNMPSTIFLERSSFESDRPERIQTHFTFPAELKDYLAESGLPRHSLIALDSFMLHLGTFLKNCSVKYELRPELFSDPEDPDWNGIRLTIVVNKELSYVYKMLKPEIYKMLWSLPDELEEKILIRFESS